MRSWLKAALRAFTILALALVLASNTSSPPSGTTSVHPQPRTITPQIKHVDYVDGCYGNAVMKSSTWGKTTHVRHLWWRIGANAVYWFCPNGTGPNKIKIFQFAYCFTKYIPDGGIYSADTQFNGWRVDSYISNDNLLMTNPVPIWLNWAQGAGSAGEQRCYGHDIYDTPWMHMASHPFWTLTMWERYDDTGLSDEIEFWDDGSRRKFFDPAIDTNVNPFG